MRSLVLLFWRLAIFRSGPSEVPVATSLLPVMCAVFLVVNVVVRMALSDYNAAAALGSSVLILLVWGVAVFWLLSFKGVKERFLQCFVALLGIDVVITLLNFGPGILGMLAGGASASPLVDLMRLSIFVLFLWDMLAKGAVYREAMNISPLQANLLAMCFAFLFSWVEFAAFAPAPVPLPQ
ncbi:Hypothetical protein HDN1F_26810 [gamma proteobacterium HdN1]|nr:Hypothetical protein HDN1F_26810 [gamma proteobacterium HdN1]